MRMRRGWVGLAVVLGVLCGACRDDDSPGGETGTGTGEEEAITGVELMECPPVSPARVRVDTIAVPADSSLVIRLEGAGRNHALWIWPADVDLRTIVIREMPGTTNGVEIDISPDPASADDPWAMLNLDGRDCAAGQRPFIVRRLETGEYTVPDGGYDDASATAFAVLRGNSGYLLASPTKSPPPEP